MQVFNNSISSLSISDAIHDFRFCCGFLRQYRCIFGAALSEMNGIGRKSGENVTIKCSDLDNDSLLCFPSLHPSTHWTNRYMAFSAPFIMNRYVDPEPPFNSGFSGGLWQGQWFTGT